VKSKQVITMVVPIYGIENSMEDSLWRAQVGFYKIIFDIIRIVK
jgi:hypothetical protein